MKFRFFIFAAIALIACAAERPEEPNWKKLTLAVPGGYRPAVAATGFRPRVIEYDAISEISTSGADLIASFGAPEMEGYDLAGSWLIEIPAIALRNDLGSSETTANVVAYLADMIADEGRPRVTFKASFVSIVREDENLRASRAPLDEIFSVSQSTPSEAPLQAILKKSAEAAILDGAEQGQLAVLDGSMRDRIEIVRLAETGRELRLWVRAGSSDASLAAQRLITTAGRLKSFGYVPAR